MIYLTLFLEFFKVGLFCFGGAFGMIPLIEEIVLAHGWVTQEQFYDLIGVCESTPGPIAVNMATYIGSTQAGLLGSVLATLGVVTPSFLIILLIASILTGFTGNRYFKGFMKGVKPVVIALIVSTGLILLTQNLGLPEGRFDWLRGVIFLLIGAFFFAWKKLRGKKPSSVLIILLSAVLGIALSLLTGG